jgi:hypothetical protein
MPAMRSKIILITEDYPNLPSAHSQTHLPFCLCSFPIFSLFLIAFFCYKKINIRFFNIFRMLISFNISHSFQPFILSFLSSFYSFINLFFVCDSLSLAVVSGIKIRECEAAKYFNEL